VIYAGIDESGYGPLLGPLCVGASAFRIPDELVASADASAITTTTAAPDPASFDLWKLLDRGVCRKPKDTRRRIAIADSKKLKSHGKEPLIHLERGVLAFAPGGPHTDDGSLFQTLGVQARVGRGTPWHASSRPLPTAQTADSIAIARNLVARALDQHAITIERLSVATLDPEDFNALYERLRNKAHVNMSLVFGALRTIDALRDGARAFVAIDRQGGRSSYRAELEAHVAQGEPVRVLHEDDERSAYEIGEGLFVSFEVAAEERHLPVALASMAAKYVRELSMERLNAYFAAFLPDLAPTAGYVEDGRRYLAEVKPILAREQIPEGAFVRTV
jgi:ribonuclease HII